MAAGGPYLTQAGCGPFSVSRMSGLDRRDQSSNKFMPPDGAWNKTKRFSYNFHLLTNFTKVN